jgi:hypothetical protein
MYNHDFFLCSEPDPFVLGCANPWCWYNNLGRPNQWLGPLHTGLFTVESLEYEAAGVFKFKVINKVTGDIRILECADDPESFGRLTWELWPATEYEDSEWE